MSIKHLERKEVLNLVYTQQADRIADDYARLNAEVERLTKAGDAMAAHIKRNDERCYIVIPDGDIRISEWNAAKKGKPRD